MIFNTAFDDFYCANALLSDPAVGSISFEYVAATSGGQCKVYGAQYLQSETGTADAQF